MSGVKVDSDVPFPGQVPERRNRPGRQDKYPWNDMKVGDSFLLPSHAYQQWAGGTVHGANARFDKAFRAGKLPELRRFVVRRDKDRFRVW